MLDVTDMILNSGDLRVPTAGPLIAFEPMKSVDRDAVMQFVQTEHPTFGKFYLAPKEGATVFVVNADGVLAGTVLLERSPEAAEFATDGALACVITASALRNKGIGSATIAACSSELLSQAFTRVIAEWVASIPLYERLGFKIWRTRQIDDSDL